MSVRSARKLGFWTACALLFGSVVGIGIFVKNGGVLKATEENGIATLIAWILGGLISLFAAISFSEIGSQRTTNVHGLSGWAETSVGKRFGYLTRFNYAVFYQAVLVLIISFFTSEIFFQVVRTQGVGVSMFDGSVVWVHVIVALVLTSFFVGVNLMSVYASGIFSSVATVLKIVPLVLAALVGIILLNVNNSGGFNNLVNSAEHPLKPIRFEGLLAGLPAVLFAYDAFLNVGTLSGKTRGGAKTVSKATLVTLIAIVILYTLISISQNLHNARWVEHVFLNVFSASGAKAISLFVWVFILISALGVTNGISAILVANFQQGVVTNTFFGAKTLKAKYGVKKATTLLLLIFLSMWTLIIFVPAIVMKSDNFVDSFSNLPTVFFFSIYAITIIGYWRRRKQINSDKINNYLFYIGSSLAIVGLFFASLYQIFYGFTIRAFISPDFASTTGFFIDQPITILQEFGIFAAGLVLFFGLPLLNAFLSKRFENNKVVINTQTLVLEDELTASSESYRFNDKDVKQSSVNVEASPKVRQRWQRRK